MNKLHINSISNYWRKTLPLVLLTVFLCLLSLFKLQAQTTLNTTATAGWLNNNGSGTVTFNFQNTNPYAVIITGVEGVVGTAGITSADIWVKTTPISGPPGVLTNANGWFQMATGTFTGVANTTTTVTQPFLTGTSVTIPAGVTYGMAIAAYSGTAGRQRYFTIPAAMLPTITVSGGGCNIIMGTLISYATGAPPTAPSITPRGWIGKLTFIPAAPCTDPPIAGTPNATATAVCTGGSSILSLVGGTGGTGQTYQWESSTTSGGPYTNEATTASLTVTPSATTFYRCQVTCGSNTDISSEIQITVPPPFPGGYYTIDNTLSTGGGNFASFGDAVAALACGISGAVVFDVASGTGPYTEQVTIPQIGGASLTNTVTFLGNGNTLSFNATLATAPHTLALNGSDFFRFNDLNVVGTGATYALVGHLWNNANDNIFTNCTFTAPANGTATTQVPFSCSGSETVATTAGLSGSNNELIGCTMTSGYYNTCFVGNSASPNTGNKVLNCIIKDQYFYGSYNLYQNGLIVSGCTFERPTRTTLSTYYGVYLSTGTTNALVENNKIRNTWAAVPTSTGTQYSIYNLSAGTVGTENRIYNNLISDINFNGTLYGVYNTVANAKIYHNTISFDQTGATGTTTTYGIYVSGATGVDVKNNNVSITRGGTGAKYCVYYTVVGVTSNYNNLYVNAAAGVNCVGFYLAGFPTLANWQTANAGVWDQQSVSVIPNPSNPAIYNYAPTNVLLDNVGINVGVATDILGATRQNPPDIGCYEFTVPLIDMGVTAMVAPGTSGCYSSTENVEMTIKNYGAATIDFSVDAVTVTCDVSGATTATLTATPTGTLAPGASMNVILSPPLDMTLNGSYSFTPYTTVVGDGNASNDGLVAPAVRNVGPVAGTLTSSLPEICVSGSPTLTLAGNYGGTIQWQESAVSATGPWTNVGSGASTYSPGVVTQTMHYQAEVSCNGNIVSSNVVTVTVNNPVLLSTTPGGRCGIGTVNLGATAAGIGVPTWYANATGGSPLGTGNTFTTPVISSTTDFYVAASEGGIGGTQTAPMPALGTPFSGNVRGFWFTAPSDFTITGLNVPLTGTTQSMTVVKFVPAVGPPVFAATTNDFVTLYLTQNNTNTGVLPVNIQINAGDVIGIMGQMGTQSAYAAVTGIQNTTINGATVPLTRMLMQFPLGTTAPMNLSTEVGGAIGVVNITYSTGCEGPRTAVTASVSTAPTVTATIADPTLCPGGTTTISASSTNDPDYTYTWASSIGGFTANGAGPHTVSPTNTTTYTVFAIDNTTGIYSGCANQATVSVITAPTLSAGTVSVNTNTYCVAGSPTLTVTGSQGGAIQWQESTVSATGPWTNVGTGATTYLPGTVTQTTHYQVEVSCQTTTLQSNVITVTVNNPQLLSTTPGSRCGFGSVTLDATADVNSTIRWYNSPIGGSVLFTGAPFATPNIATTTTFYAEAGVGSGGADSVSAPIGGTSGVYHHMFAMNTPTGMSLTDIGIKSNQVVGTSTSWDVYYRPNNYQLTPGANTSATGWILLNSVTLPSAGNGATDYTYIALGLSLVIPPGATYSFYIAPGTGTTHAYNTTALGTSAAGGNANATFIGGNRGSALFNCSSSGGLPTVRFRYSLGCQGTRVPVVATVTTAPSISVGATSTTICAGESTTLSVTSPNDPDYTYTWNPGNLSGASVTVNPIISTVYTLTAVDNTAGPNAGCGNSSTVAITVNPILVSLNPTASPSSVCEGGNVNLSANAIVPGYVMNPASTTTFIDISATGTDIAPGLLGDDTEHNISIPSFTFNGVAYTTARVGVNGIIALGSTAGEVALTNTALPTTTNTAGNVFFAPYWDDLDIQTVLTIKTQTVGNVFIIQYTNAAHNAFTTGGITFQVQMNLITGVVTYVYNDVIFGDVLYDSGVNATVGIQMSATSAINYSFNTASLTAGQAISFSPNSATVSWAGPNSFSSTLSNPSLTSVISADGGTYTVTATGSNGCTTSSTVNVTVSVPAANTTTASSPCATPYVWSVNSQTYTATGTYTQTISNVNGCIDTEILDLTIGACNTTVNLNLVIEGYWNGANEMLPVLLNQGEPFSSTQCDHITVELISPATVLLGPPYTADYTTTAMLNTNGTASAVFTSAVSGNYYIVIKHRNALQTWSANAEAFPLTTSYSFSSGAAQAYGSNQIEVATGVWALYSGDCAADENIDLLDVTLQAPDIEQFVFGYLYDPLNTNYTPGGIIATDINGDGNVDLLDGPVVEANLSNFIYSLHP